MELEDKYTLVSLEDAMSPIGKDVVQIYENYYWIIYDGDKILFHKSGGKICNQNKSITDKFIEIFKRDYGPKFHIRKVHIVFVPWDD